MHLVIINLIEKEPFSFWQLQYSNIIIVLTSENNTTPLMCNILLWTLSITISQCVCGFGTFPKCGPYSLPSGVSVYISICHIVFFFYTCTSLVQLGPSCIPLLKSATDILWDLVVSRLSVKLIHWCINFLEGQLKCKSSEVSHILQYRHEIFFKLSKLRIFLFVLTLKMEEKKQHFYHIMLFNLKKKK